MSVFTERNSIRKFDTNFKFTQESLNALLDEALRAPSSMNLQPNRLFVVLSEEGKKKLGQVFMQNELQLKTASALILITTDLTKLDQAQRIFDQAVALNMMPKEVRDVQLERVKMVKSHVPSEKILHDGLIDGGLFAMQLMLVAKAHGYDTCPIGGFDKKAIHEALNIPTHLHPVLIVAIGKRDENGYKSYRLPATDVTTYL